MKESTGRVPQRRDFDDSHLYAIKKVFGNFSEAIKAAGLKPRRVERATKEELISSLKKYHDKYGKSPSIGTKEESLYHFNTYFKVLNCKGWNEVLELAGLPIHITTRKHLPTEPKEVVSYARKLIKEENIKSINILLRHKRFHGVDRINSIFGNKYHFGELIGLEVKGYDIPFEKVKDKIFEVMNELGRAPSSLEMSSRGLSEQYLRKKFGSYNSLLKKIGLTPYAEKPDICELSNNELIEIYKDISRKNGFENGCGVRVIKQLSGIGADTFISRFGSINNLRSVCGYKNDRPNLAMWSYENIESLFIAKTEQYNTRITQAIVYSDEDFPSITTIRRYLKCGSFIEFTERIQKQVTKAAR